MESCIHLPFTCGWNSVDSVCVIQSINYNYICIFYKKNNSNFKEGRQAKHFARICKTNEICHKIKYISCHYKWINVLLCQNAFQYLVTFNCFDLFPRPPLRHKRNLHYCPAVIFCTCTTPGLDFSNKTY